MTDLISRSAFMQALHNAGGCDAEKGSWADGWDKAINHATGLLEDAPAVAPVEKTTSLSVPIVVNFNEDKLKELVENAARECLKIQVLHCKDCKHWTPLKPGVACKGMCDNDRGIGDIMGPNEFCSRGERIEQ